MKMGIELPDKSNSIEKMRELFKNQVSRPLEDALALLGYSIDYFGFIDDEDLLDNTEYQNEAPEIAAGSFSHFENDPDDPIAAHHFKFWSNGRGMIFSNRCSLCENTEIIGTWVKILKMLIKLIKSDSKRMRARTANIKKLSKTIALLK